MKRTFLAGLCLINTLFILSLVYSDGFAQAKNETIYTVAEQQPEFPGGPNALSHYLAENIKIPGALLRKRSQTGPVAARFIIDKLGFVRDVRIIARPEEAKQRKGMEEFLVNIITAVEKMPRWNPGMVGGKPVNVFYTLPVEVNK